MTAPQGFCSGFGLPGGGKRAHPYLKAATLTAHKRGFSTLSQAVRHPVGVPVSAEGAPQEAVLRFRLQGRQGRNLGRRGVHLSPGRETFRRAGRFPGGRSRRLLGDGRGGHGGRWGWRGRHRGGGGRRRGGGGAGWRRASGIETPKEQDDNDDHACQECQAAHGLLVHDRLPRCQRVPV